MNFLKKIARKILANEIKEMKDEKAHLYSDYCKAINERMDKQKENSHDLEKLRKEIEAYKKQIKDLTDKNEIMSKYYELDKDPSDEEKIKIRIDLKIHDLEMQLLEERLNKCNDKFDLLNLYDSYSRILIPPTPYIPYGRFY